MLSNCNLSYAQFTPKAISGLLLWLDSSDFGTITKDESDLVSLWKDKSGNGNDVSQATEGNRPVWTTSVQNGRDALLFVPANKNIIGTGSAILNTDTYDIIVVCKQDSTGTSDCIGTGAVTLGGNILLQSQTVNTKSRVHYWGSAASTVFDSSSDEVFVWQIIEQYQDATKTYLRRAKADEGSATTAAKSGATKLINIGGREASYTSLFNGYIGEVLIYSNALSTGNRTLIENYLYAKWGL